MLKLCTKITNNPQSFLHLCAQWSDGSLYCAPRASRAAKGAIAIPAGQEWLSDLMWRRRCCLGTNADLCLHSASGAVGFWCDSNSPVNRRSIHQSVPCLFGARTQPPANERDCRQGQHLMLTLKQHPEYIAHQLHKIHPRVNWVKCAFNSLLHCNVFKFIWEII
jgi:hypothetical protein